MIDRSFSQRIGACGQPQDRFAVFLRYGFIIVGCLDGSAGSICVVGGDLYIDIRALIEDTFSKS